MNSFKLTAWSVTLVLLLFGVSGHAAKGEKAQSVKTKPTTVLPQPSQAEPSPPEVATGEQINWLVISQGGSMGSSDNYRLGVSVGQEAAGYGTSINYGLNLGFWQVFDCCQNRGNADGVTGPVGPVDIADVTYLVAYLWTGGPAPACTEQGNVDGILSASGWPTDVADVTYLVAYLWTGGPEPPLCP